MTPFQRFLTAERDAVWRFAVAAVGREEAEDVFQETFLAALRAWPRMRADANLRAWVLTIAANKANDHHRARRRRPVPTADVGDAPAPADQPPDDELWERVRTLPPKQRAAVTLRYAVDLDYAAIAGALSCSPEAARRSVHEGLKKLRERKDR